MRNSSYLHDQCDRCARLWPLAAVLVFALSSPSSLWASPNQVKRPSGPPTVVQDNNETFPTTPVGQTSTLCQTVCYCNGGCGTNPCDATGSGTIELDHNLSTPFSAYNYLLEPFGPTNCSGGMPVQLPIFVGVGQQLAYTVSFSPTSSGTFNDYLNLSGYNLFLSGSTPAGSVTPGQPGTLYAVSDTGSNQSLLYSIFNFPANPQVSVIGATGLSFPAIAISPVSGIIYAADPSTGYLYQLDAQSGASTFIGDTGLAAAGLVALACDRQGRLFTWGQNDGELYQLNASSGAASTIGETGYAAGGDLAFDLDGTLYGSTGTDLIQINPASGAATYIGSFQTSNIFGLAVAADGTLYAGQTTSGSTGQLYRVAKSTGQLTPIGGTLTESIADLALFGGSTQRGSASLVPSPLSGWSSPLVVSTTRGTQVDSPNPTTAEPLYLSWSIQNQGDLATFGTFFIDVDLDGSLLNRWSWSDPLQPQWYLDLKDYPFGPLSAGTHTLKLVPDSTDVIGATSNTYTKTITVSESVGTRVVISTKQGFDICRAPTQAQMQNWWSSGPYWDMNIYIGGNSRACRQPQLSASWVSSIWNQGWNLIPTWVGPQAPCTKFRHRISGDPATADAEGRTEAEAAAAAASTLGLTASGTSGTIIYYDMENYSGDASCEAAVNAFMSGWVGRLHELGSQAGGYGSACLSQISGWWTITNVPDDIWAGAWLYPGYNANATASRITCIPRAYWANHQRIHQYSGDHSETHGGLTFSIDSDVSNGEVAGLNAHPSTRAPEQPSTEQGPEVRAMGMLSPNVGWALVGGRFLWTKDGGRTWLDRTPILEGDPAVRAVYFLDEMRGWAAVAVPTPASGPEGLASLEVVATADGGQSWRAETSPVLTVAAMALNLWTIHVQFIDARIGWVVIKTPSSSNFSLGRLFRTENGGVTWTELPIPLGEGVRFVTRDLGWTAGGASGDELYVTRDGGLTWSAQAVANGEAAFYDLPTFTSERDGVLPVTLLERHPRLAFYVTHDRGQTWMLTKEIPLVTAPTIRPPVSVVGFDHWIAAIDGQLYVIGGEGGLPARVRAIPGVIGLVFADSSTGWAHVLTENCHGAKGEYDFNCSSRSTLVLITDGEPQPNGIGPWP